MDYGAIGNEPDHQAALWDHLARRFAEHRAEAEASGKGKVRRLRPVPKPPRSEKAESGEQRENRTGWWSGLDLNSRAPSIQPSWIVVSIPPAMNWPHFLVADEYSDHVGMLFDGEVGVSSKP